MSEAKHYEKHINQKKCKTFCLQSAYLILKHSNQLFGLHRINKEMFLLSLKTETVKHVSIFSILFIKTNTELIF